MAAIAAMAAPPPAKPIAGGLGVCKDGVSLLAGSGSGAAGTSVSVSMDGKIFSIRTELDSELVSLSWLEQLLGLSEFQSSSSPIASQEKEEKVEGDKGKRLWVWKSKPKRLPNFYGNAKLSIGGKNGKRSNLSWRGSSSSLESDSSRDEIFSCQKGECFTKKIDVGPLSIGPEKREDYVVVASDVAQQRCSNIVVDLIGQGDGLA
ncbi:hypothetical protein LWI29_023562 [Acer saccharum]|uniref:Uncharacterized protein n=1 Tax=Acer saccharum TaxID=4024 RepID=A0AA39TGI5_ACESA|nr:hypothetical protein LWI29_023562 [Acer saccharum]